MFILGGLVSTAFGVVLFARPGMGAISLALVFGLFNLIAGSWMLVRGIELRRANSRLHTLVRRPRRRSPPERREPPDESHGGRQLKRPPWLVCRRKRSLCSMRSELIIRFQKEGRQ